MKIRQQKKKKGEQMRADHQPNKGKMITYQKKHVHFSFFVFLFAVFILSVLRLFFSFSSNMRSVHFGSMMAYRRVMSFFFLIIFLLHSHAAFRMVVEATCVGNTFCLFLCLIFYLFSEQHQFHMAYDNIPNMNIPYDRRSYTTECPLSIQHQVYINIDFLSG